jgi:hypothetical protein
VLTALFLTTTTLAGIGVVQRFFPGMTPLARLFGGFVVGVVVSAWSSFLIAWCFAWATEDSLAIGMVTTIVAAGATAYALRDRLDLRLFRMTGVELGVLAASLVFSFWLMDARLSGDPLTVSSNAWGDTAFHISNLRSFSEASNFPPEFPLFDGEIMRYHFGIDFYAGALEYGGLPVEWALNLPGAIGFAAMIVFVFEIGRLLFRSSWVGAIAVVLLVTNGSLSFLRFFELHDWDVGEAISNLWDHDRYLAIGPYTLTGDHPDRISLFWTLNVYLTQTQLIVGMAAVLFVTYGLLRPLEQGRPLWTGEALVLGSVLGVMFWINGVLYVPAAGFMLCLLLLFGRWREGVAFAVPAVLIAVPQAIWLNGGLGGGATEFHLGYLVCTTPLATSCYPDFNLDEPGAYVEFVRYWWLNLGLVLPLLILGFIRSKRKERLVWLAFMSIFAFGNVVALGRDLGGHNHKVFNLWETLINIFAAFAFVKLWTVVTENVKLGDFTIPSRAINVAAAAAMPVIFLFLVLSGIIDFMVLKNDPRFEVFGNRANSIEWIQGNTAGDARFLTVYGETYTTPALAGRGVFWGGFEPWTTDKGHDVEERRALIQQMYGTGDKAEACRLLLENQIDYVQVGPPERTTDKFPVNAALYDGQFVRVYDEMLSDGEMVYFDVAQSCSPVATRSLR